MHIEQLRIFCTAKKGVTAHFPFDNVTLVFKVMGKMFLLTGLDSWENGDPKINLKCDPEKAIEFRESYQSETYIYKKECSLKPFMENKTLAIIITRTA